MSKSRFFRVFAVIIVLLMPFGFFIYFEMNKKEPQKPLSVYGEVPYFKFVNQSGDTVTSDELKGYIYVTDFFFTHCPGVCKKLSAIMEGVQESYKDEVKIRLVSFTVDPMRDSAAVLKEYAAKYNAQPFKWNFLTGSKDKLYELAEKGFKVSVTQDDSEGNDFTHSEKLILVDAAGKIRGYFNAATDSTQIDSLYNSIERILIEKPR